MRLLERKNLIFLLPLPSNLPMFLPIYSYLLSTDLKHYAKEPKLNRRWNMNAAIEANLNMQKGGFKWSIAPQFRYQMLSSFKSKYPIKENLMDLGIKVGVIKTIK